MKYIEIKNSLYSQLQIFSIYSVEILFILEVIEKRGFLKSKKIAFFEYGKFRFRYNFQNNENSNGTYLAVLQLRVRANFFYYIFHQNFNILEVIAKTKFFIFEKCDFFDFRKPLFSITSKFWLNFDPVEKSVRKRVSSTFEWPANQG